MIKKIKLFTCLLILNTPSSIQQLVEQNVVKVAPNTYEVLQDTGGPVLEEIIPLNTIQVIDVKDDQHQVISNLKNLIMSHEIDNVHNDSILNHVPLIQDENNTIVLEANSTVNVPKTLENQLNSTNVKVDNRSVSSQNVSYVHSITQQNVTTAKKELSSINSVQNISSSNNGPQNNGLNSFVGRRVGHSGLINVTFTSNNTTVSNYNNVVNNKSNSDTNPFNTTSIVVRSGVPIKETNNSKLGISFDIKNGTVVNSQNNNTKLIYNNAITNDTASTEILDEHIGVVALLNDTNSQDLNLLLEDNLPDSNGTLEDSDISYRSDLLRKKHYTVRIVSKSKNQTNQHITEDDISKEKSRQPDDSNGNLDNVFLIMNTGNISGFQANKPDNGHDQKLSSNMTIDKSNSKLLSSLIDTSLNRLAANMLDQNLSSIKSKNVFLILNSGTISNFQYDTHNTDGDMNYLSKNSFEPRRLHKNEHKGKFSIDKNNRIVDIKFRRTGNLDTSNHEASINNEDQISLENDSLKPSTATELITLNNRRNGNQIQSNSNTDFNNNNNFDLGQVLFGVEPINPEFDFNNLNVLDGAIDILNRLKRSSKDHKRRHRVDEHDNEKSNEKYTHLGDCQRCKALMRSRENKNKSLKVSKLLDPLKFNDSVESDCPLSIFFKLALKELYDQLTSSDNLVLNIILPYLSYLMEGKEKIINLATQELINLPFPIKIRLQLLQGDPSEAIKEILLYINSILCQ